MRKLIISFLLLTFVLCTETANAKSCKLTVQVVEYPPLATKQDNGDWSGLNFDYLDALFKEARCRYQVVEAPHARGIKLIEDGMIDMALNLSRTAEREKHFHFIGPQRIETIKLAAKSSMYPKITSWAQFDDLDARLIWQIGAFYGDKIEQKIQQNLTLKHKMLYSADNVAMVDTVNKGGADGFFLLVDFFNYQKANNPAYANIELHPITINSNDVFFGFSKKSVNSDMLQRFQGAYQRLAEEGVLQKIEQKYANQQEIRLTSNK